MSGKTTTRHQHLHPISKEHPFGLLFCWRIKQGLNMQVSPERMARYVEAFWEGNLQPHFNEEESLLLHDTNDPLVQKALQEHVNIREQVELIIAEAGGCSTHAITHFVEIFESHILFEERELFPHLERELSPSQFLLIDARLKDSTNAQLKNTFHDQFWRDARSSL